MTEHKALEEYYADFRGLFIEFLDYILKLKPGDYTMTIIRYGTSLLSNKTLCSQFMDTLSPYKEEIYAENEHFFVEDFGKSNDSYFANEMRSVAEIWKLPHITPENKEIIWKYIKTLTKLGSKLQERSAAA